METTPFASEFTATEVAHKHPRSRPGFATKCNEIHLVLVRSLLLYFRRTRLSNFTHRFLHQQLLFLFHKSHELDQYNMIFFCFYPVLATTNKRKTCTGTTTTTTTDMRKNNSTGQQEKAHKSDDRGSVT